MSALANRPIGLISNPGSGHNRDQFETIAGSSVASLQDQWHSVINSWCSSNARLSSSSVARRQGRGHRIHDEVVHAHDLESSTVLDAPDARDASR